MSHEHSPLPWHVTAIEGGWDGICDARHQLLFVLRLNVPDNADFAVHACNSHDDLFRQATKLKRENDRMRAALEKIAALTPAGAYQGPQRAAEALEGTK